MIRSDNSPINSETSSDDSGRKYEDSSDYFITKLMFVIEKRKISLILVASLGLIIGSVFFFLSPVKFEAEAVILPVSGRSSSGMDFEAFGASSLLEIMSSGKIPSANSEAKTLISSHLSSYQLHNQILMENNLISRLIKNPGSKYTAKDYQEATYELMKLFELGHFRTTWGGHSELFRLIDHNAFRLKLEWENPEEAAIILRSYLHKLNQNLKAKEIKRLDSIISYFNKISSTFESDKRKQSMDHMILSLHERKAFVQSSPNCFFQIIDPVFPKYKPIRDSAYLAIFTTPILMFLISITIYYNLDNPKKSKLQTL